VEDDPEFDDEIGEEFEKFLQEQASFVAASSTALVLLNNIATCSR